MLARLGNRMHNGVVAVRGGRMASDEPDEVGRMDSGTIEQGGIKRMIDDDLIGFELGWFQHGGGPAAKIREEFGLGDVEFFTRLRSRLDASDDDSMPPHVVEQMKAVCRKRLWLARAS